MTEYPSHGGMGDGLFARMSRNHNRVAPKKRICAGACCLLLPPEKFTGKSRVCDFCLAEKAVVEGKAALLKLEKHRDRLRDRRRGEYEQSKQLDAKARSAGEKDA